MTTSMTHSDTAWFHMDRPDNLMVVTSMFWFEEPADWDLLRDVFQERVIDRYPRFHQRVIDRTFGVPRWEDDRDFDLDRHLEQVTLPPPGDEIALQAFVSEIASEDLPHDRPLWRAWMVDGYGSGSAVVFRIHHCLADGIALARILLTMTDDAAGDPTIVTRASDPRTFRDRVAEQVAEAIRHPVRTTVDSARTAIDGTASLAKLLFAPPDHRSSLKGPIGSAKRTAWLAPIPLATIKRIGKAHDATVNDVMITAISGALHRYLVARGDRSKDLRAFVPINLRPLDRPVPRDLGNRFGLGLLSMPVGADRLEDRLGAAKRRMTRIKHTPEGPVSYGILTAIGYLPKRAETVVVRLFGMKGSLVVTNVPGPQQPLYLAGSRIAGVVAWEPESASIALGIGILSVDGQVVIGAIADRHRVPDPESILIGIHAELGQLERTSPAHRVDTTVTAA